MTVVLVLLTAALAAAAAFAFGLALGRRPGPARDAGVADALRELSGRLDRMAEELAAAQARLRQEGRRNRFLGELASSIDLDEVLGRTLEAAGALPGVDAVAIRITGPGEPLLATLGLSPEQAEEQVVTGPPDGRAARSVALGYRYEPDELAAGAGELLRAAVAVPVPGEAGPIGVLTVYTKQEGRTFGDEDIGELEELALRAGPAIENARRFREARQLADLDALTGLHNRRYFHETLAREVARAARYRRRLALLVLDLDEFKAINDRIGHLTGDAVLAEVAQRIRAVVRSAEVPCRVGGDEFAVIMPESGLEEAEQLYRRLQRAVASPPLEHAGSLLLSAGIAELEPADDATSFFQRADDALYRAKEAGKGRAVAAG